ncbi:MAG: hypothetical protein K0R69_3172 [Clostridia bacterium]|jgi:hypothetical protein|nr:hypothetical protein [Clostridia bacterium]
MGKILSVLEKYKLIEKEDEKVPVSDDLTKTYPDAVSSHMTSEFYSKETAPQTDSLDLSDDHHLADSPYTKNLTLEEIYDFYKLNTPVITDTVFVLENLINALPNELPEYVKKTTLNNILVASSMNLEQLLSDGTSRTSVLNQFADDYANQNSHDITVLKQEIDKLSALISDYHQQIKTKEVMVNKQLSLIKLEEERIQNVLAFFEK